jgi:hypothetical protein
MKLSVFVASLLAVTILPGTAMSEDFPIADGKYCDQSQSSKSADNDEIGDGSITISYPSVSFSEHSFCEVKGYKKVDDDYKVVLTCTAEEDQFETKALWSIKSNTRFELDEIEYERCGSTEDNSTDDSASNSGTDAFLATEAGPIDVSQWQQFKTGDDSVYLDAIRNSQSKTEFPLVKTLTDYDSISSSQMFGLSELEVVEFDCSQNKYRSKGIVWHQGNMGQGPITQKFLADDLWVPNNEYYGTLANYACGSPANNSANSGRGWTDFFSMGTMEYSNSNDKKDAVRLSSGQIAGENTTCSLAFERGGERLSERSVVALTIGAGVYQLPTQDGVFSPTSKKELDQLHQIVSDLTKPDTNSFSVAESASAFSADFSNQNAQLLAGSLEGCDSIEQNSSNSDTSLSNTAPSADQPDNTSILDTNGGYQIYLGWNPNDGFFKGLVGTNRGTKPLQIQTISFNYREECTVYPISVSNIKVPRNARVDVKYYLTLFASFGMDTKKILVQQEIAKQLGVPLDSDVTLKVGERIAIIGPMGCGAIVNAAVNTQVGQMSLNFDTPFTPN